MTDSMLAPLSGSQFHNRNSHETKLTHVKYGGKKGWTRPYSWRALRCDLYGV